MAKRKRLTPANPDFMGQTTAPGSAGDTTAPGFAGDTPLPGSGLRPPIADVASDAAATSALRDVSAAMTEARETGRMVAQIPLDQIKLDYLVRDRIAVDDAEMDALVTSIRERGQQTPIEVVELSPGHYGLISGWRRCQALQRIAKDGGDPVQALALLRRPEAASDAYLAMVEENEIRAGLSYFERARIVVKAVEQGVFEDQKQALRGLFGTASRAKRSKIGSFVDIVQALDEVLAHPHRIGERQGLMLAKRLEDEPTFPRTLIRLLSIQPDRTAETEQALLSDLLAKGPKSLEPAETVPKKAKTAQMTERELRPGVKVSVDRASGSIQISGHAVTPDLRDRLFEWLERES
ncbi:ParB N-terminal domain-containing protein [uncultured Tateyamaria sp.]|uniref:ParB/RepB/Spo0J family partition protein n=1 Tax=uncultured Tateyamaria sp. TaxID=455651 RepID=UPI00261B3B80|nr:ParB N-terminal domain-containing protein [uncultured Tateyamaria sp.]